MSHIIKELTTNDLQRLAEPLTRRGFFLDQMRELSKACLEPGAEKTQLSDKARQLRDLAEFAGDGLAAESFAQTLWLLERS